MSLSNASDSSAVKDVGFRIGEIMAHRLTTRMCPFTDSKDVIKVICKDLWFSLFRQQASRLQASKRGVYIIHDSNFPRLHNLSKCTQEFHLEAASNDAVRTSNQSYPVTRSPKKSKVDHASMIKSSALMQMDMTSGVLEGFLFACGYKASVECVLSANLPACSFQVTIIEPSQKIKPTGDDMRLQSIDGGPPDSAII